MVQLTTDYLSQIIKNMKTVWSDKIDTLLQNGLSLEKIGVRNWALQKNEALLVLQKFEEMRVAILGGDVCELKEGIVQYNYDSWHCIIQAFA